jgi:cytochrome o ubiquinol oxidase subunit 1
MFGTLTLAAFAHGTIETFGQAVVVFGGVGVVGLLFYFKRWTWLWKEWITSLDAKKIGVMYIILSLAMIARGFIDALMMRGQQALSVGDNAGFLSGDHFAHRFLPRTARS